MFSHCRNGRSADARKRLDKTKKQFYRLHGCRCWRASKKPVRPGIVSLFALAAESVRRHPTVPGPKPCGSLFPSFTMLSSATTNLQHIFIKTDSYFVSLISRLRPVTASAKSKLDLKGLTVFKSQSSPPSQSSHLFDLILPWKISDLKAIKTYK